MDVCIISLSFICICMCCAVLSHSAMSDSLWPHGLWPTRLLCPWDSPGKNTGELPCPPPGDLPNPGMEPRSPALQADSLPSMPPGKPMCIYICVCVYIYIYICIMTEMKGSTIQQNVKKVVSFLVVAL